MEVATATEASAPAAGGGASRRGHPFPWLDVAISEPYYFLHLIAFFSYFAARTTAPSAEDDAEFHSRLIRREIQAVLVFLVLFTVKIVKEEHWETFIADSLLYAKGLLLVVTFVIDYWLTVGYLLGFIVIYAMAQQPPYDGTVVVNPDTIRFHRAVCLGICLDLGTFPKWQWPARCHVDQYSIVVGLQLSS
ncbi:thioredoxin-related transmembrane protein 2 [Hordeum vulgare]|nr:thioredoxin-related transmembrane protein 2 [Hordeum vulgare]